MDVAEVESRPDAAAWEGLEEMRDGLRTFLVRQCPDENEVEDVIQETFLRAARYRRSHRVQSLRPWAMRIALNLLADSRRRGIRAHCESQSEEPFDPPDREEPERSDSCYRVGCLWLDGETAQQLVLRTLGRLRAQDRALLDSYYAGERGTSSAALECGIPQPLVKVRLYRARKRLLRALRHRVLLEPRWERLAS